MVEGQIAPPTAGQLHSVAGKLVDCDERDYLLDSHATTAIDSTGLEPLTWLSRKCGQTLDALEIATAGPTASTIPRITLPAERINCFESTDEAVATTLPNDFIEHSAALPRSCLMMC